LDSAVLCMSSPLWGVLNYRKFMRIIRYIKETAAEMKHVTWPTKKQAVIYTVLIVIISLFVAAYLGLADWLFTSFVKLFV
jgi:preprotein translocase subunit SecE